MWVEGLLFGPLAIAVCVIAVAFVGVSMLTGRIHVRRAVQTLLGVIVLLSAPTIAAIFVQSSDQPLQPVLAHSEPKPAAVRDLPPVDVDPYAGASLRRD